jgi:hypothetical protein
MSIEPGTAIALGGTAFSSAKLAEKILGPTAEYLGNGLKAFAEQRVKNVKTILEVAARRLGTKIDQPGSIPPKVFKELIDGASYCEDELSAEYYGGVLASSRSPVGRDDRGASHMKMIETLSTYQIRLHFIIYTAVREICKGRDLIVSLPEHRKQMGIYIPYESYFKSMLFGENEDVTKITHHALMGLVREQLLDDDVRYGSHGYIKEKFASAPGDGLLATPSAMGIELFLWATGNGRANEGFLSPELEVFIPEGLSISPEAMLWTKTPQHS